MKERVHIADLANTVLTIVLLLVIIYAMVDGFFLHEKQVVIEVCDGTPRAGYIKMPGLWYARTSENITEVRGNPLTLNMSGILEEIE